MGVVDLLMPVSTLPTENPPPHTFLFPYKLLLTILAVNDCLQDPVNDESQGVSSEQHVTYRKRKRDTEGGTCGGWEELVLDEVKVPGKRVGKTRKGRDGPVVGLVVQQHDEASIAWA